MQTRAFLWRIQNILISFNPLSSGGIAQSDTAVGNKSQILFNPIRRSHVAPDASYIFLWCLNTCSMFVNAFYIREYMEP